MALTAIQIYQLLEKSNCGECGVPTCLAFAMKVAQKQAALEDCPRCSDDAKAALGAAAAPPMATVTIGTGDRALALGGETVLYRHAETFYRSPGIAIALSAALPAEELGAQARAITALEFDRVGQGHKPNLIALRDEGDAAQFAAAAGTLAEATTMPIMLMTSDAAAAGAAADKLAGKKPLLYAADDSNFDAMLAVAKEKLCALTLKADGDVGKLVAMSGLAQQAGVNDLLLDSGATNLGDVLQHQTAMRRACLKEKVRPLGYPTVFVPQGDSGDMKALATIVGVCKYAGVVVLESATAEALLPVITARLNIYTDPQKPIQIPGGLYQVGEPGPESPVLVTTNFSLTYYTVEGEVSASKVASWIIVVDTEGTSVLTAWAADKFTPESITSTVKSSGIEDKVTHRKIVLPGGVAVLKGKLEEASGWEAMVGPREATGIPKLLKTAWSA
ncbi:MAG: acetyl-CoA decarbonylase/synthase complex subunit gamma [Armatimonadetes bacterium]|nr:acetyl-CoA decarbonylase/synthase complex subunit gamma [Armatimonadota bacterium]